MAVAASLLDVAAAAALGSTQIRGSGVDAAAAASLASRGRDLGQPIMQSVGWAECFFSLSSSCWAAGPNLSR